MHPDLVGPSGHLLQLDIFFPALKLAFEYQGIQHYKDTKFFGPQKIYAERVS